MHHLRLCQTETVETRSWTATELDAGPSSCCVDQASLHTPLEQLMGIVAELPNVNLVHPFVTINCQDALSGTVCQTEIVETRSWTATELDTGPSSCSTEQASLLIPLELEIEADIPSMHLGHAPVTGKSPNAGQSSQSTKQDTDPTDVNNTSCSEADMSSSTVDFNDYHPGNKRFTRTRSFLFPGKTLCQLHNKYVSHCEASSVRAVARKYLTEVFHQLNMSFFKPRKDQCDACMAAKHGNVSNEQYQCHLLKKPNAQQMKARDKGLADDSISLWTMDLQSVLLSPKTQASALYHKTKLALHNMTYFNLKSKEGFCYVYDETHGDLSGDIFASLHFNYFLQYLEQNPGIKKLIILSDGCGYQNKLHCIANSFLHLALERAVTIEQKYLGPGHTQMECNSMHSVIERRLNGDIFVPHDYVLAI
ncbi:hypothetical protein PoB_005513700 [Plakobranchus ocellatus]|uniref:Integrase catalytic domain-containing protein n=1 Tax=Plakobranchus ocellatus TaxID=259542 RepID=A0AAV4CAP8_9GAST|nr:hypothetical protein PoB_005513700 [Plakobranchus ocellatus]